MISRKAVCLAPSSEILFAVEIHFLRYMDAAALSPKRLPYTSARLR
ncbi:hypothetical protein [Desulforegula conservatrix]|nr:hypothetical protein [Desulforegula conservatrix]